MSSQAALQEALAHHQGGEHRRAITLSSAAAEAIPDNGAVSLNLWITPDGSNLETHAGGLVLWNKGVPDEHFDATGEEMMHMSQALVAEPDAEPGYVSYASNRAMTLRSNALHKTHRLQFRDAYPHRRGSIRLLYGKPG